MQAQAGELGSAILVFFGFLEVFDTFGQKPKKPRENKKPKKKLQDPCRHKLVS